jgi:hypothetical protein
LKIGGIVADIKIDQMGVVKQIAGMFNTGNCKNVVNFFMMNQINESKEREALGFWDMFRELPEPRFDNLERIIFSQAVAHLPTDSQRASFIGLSRQTFSNWRKKFGYDKQIEAEVIRPKQLTE